ncbi:MAG TPA: glycosyltransferase family 39 protein [Anaerolineales bacterium]|nr:glycosyltransferase family 39 protein [Anaerolineales bacterium]
MQNKLLALIILISLAIGTFTLRRGHEWGDDFAWYILQSKSILNGTTDQFMQESAFTNYQSTTYLGPLAYPWGYPLILTPVYALKGISPLALKLPALIFYAGFLVCLYLLMRDRLTQNESLLVVSLFAFNPLLIQFLDQILSDIPFLFFSTLSLLLMTGKNKHNALSYALIGTSIFFTTFLRTTGILLLGSFLIVQFFQFVKNHTYRPAAMEIIRRVLIVCLVFALFWLSNAFLFPSGGESYFSQYAGMTLARIKDSIVAYFNVFSLFFGEAKGWRYLYYGLFAFFLWGAWEKRKQEPLFLLFFALWMLVHITYPYWQGSRYIFPLLPIFIYLAFEGMKAAIEWLPDNYSKLGQRTLYGFWLLIALVFLFISSAHAYANVRDHRAINGPFDPYSVEVYNYIKDKTPPQSVVVFFKPRVMVMMTDHRTIMSTECDRMLKGDYIVLSRKAGRNQQIPLEDIGACNLPLDQVLKNNRFIVYKIQK